MLIFFIQIISATYLSIISEDSKLASIQIIQPKSGNTKRLVYRLGTEDDQCIISVNGEPLFTYKIQDHEFEILTGFSTSDGVKIVDPENKFYFRDLQQPMLFVLDDFEIPLDGWSDTRVSQCQTIQNYFLGGPCYFSNNTVSKTFVGLPSHEYITISFNFHFIDQWQGEIAQLRVDKLIVWQDTYNWCDKVMPWLCYKQGINSCGGDAPDQIGQAIRLTLYHINSFVNLEFSTTLGKKDACQASWGIDNVAIYVY
ncbi:unnamed protein product [Paramecium sonneborni]|uniref:Uncharacterized protein n=1 Tax=Paramecium sonneborni TaxID=65129 RepID=A0A8S1KP03_9CILI|nr:unnamed protein product [Paramecium sonneborni]